MVPVCVAGQADEPGTGAGAAPHTGGAQVFTSPTLAPVSVQADHAPQVGSAAAPELAHEAVRLCVCGCCHVSLPVCPPGQAWERGSSRFVVAGLGNHGAVANRVAHVGAQVFTSPSFGPTLTHADQAPQVGGSTGVPTHEAVRLCVWACCHVSLPVWPPGHAIDPGTVWDCVAGLGVTLASWVTHDGVQVLAVMVQGDQPGKP
jgi:hypothetical protein